MRYLQSTPPFPALPDARAHHDRPPPASLMAAAVHAQSEGVLIATRRWTRHGLNIIFANESLCAMTGYTVAELREQGQGFLHENPADLAALHRWQKRLVPGSILNGEGRLVRKDGVRMYSAWNYCPVSDERGRVTHIVATYRDLTEKQRLQEALIHSQRMDAVGRLAGGVAHDFNNLLSVINGYCEMMAMQAGVRRMAGQELEEIHQASQKAAHLVRQLLAFSRRQAQNPRVVNLDHLVCDNTEILKRLLKPSHALDLALTAGAANIHVDPAQIQQVLLNLALNARDALPPDTGGRIRIGTEVCVVGPGATTPTGGEIPPGRYALLTVSDNGHGMSEETRAHLFEPFFTTKEPGKGTGLGLSLVYGVVRQSNGFIRVHSTPGVGSSFEIFLPVTKAPAQPLAVPMPLLSATQGREHVALLEEDDVVRKMVAGILASDGYAVTSGRNRDELAASLKHSRRAVSLLIVHTGPGSDPGGERLARELHERHPRMRIISTCTPGHDLLSFVRADRQAQLLKPFTLSALMKTARALLDARARLHSCPST